MEDQAPKKYRVLVIEDEQSLEDAIRIKLTQAGLDVTAFDDGKKALDEIRGSSEKFDGVWLDFDVRSMNGLEFMQQFITIPDWERCPVLIVSNTGNPDLIKQAVNLGAKEWIIKAEVRLDDTVRRFIEYVDQANR